MKHFNKTPFSRCLRGFNNLLVVAGTVIFACSISVFADADTQPKSEEPEAWWNEVKVEPQAWWKEVKVDLSPEYFYWEEDYNGNKLLDESGFRIGLEAAYNPLAEKGWIWASRVKVYFGAVGYNGSLQNLVTGAVTPFKSTTDYYGILGEAGYGYRFGLGQDYFLDVLGRVTLDFWVRRLGGGQYGYDEYWFPISIKAGLDLSPKDVGALGLKVPVYTYQTADHNLFGVTFTTTLHPEPMVSPYAEAGYKFTKNFSLTGFFDSYWFKQSAVNKGFLQPESKSYEVGAKIGWTF